jgi:hypothetical protein
LEVTSSFVYIIVSIEVYKSGTKSSEIFSWSLNGNLHARQKPAIQAQKE